VLVLPNEAPYVLIKCFREFRNFITTFLMNLVVRELPEEHRAVGVLRRHEVPRGVEVVKVEGTNLSCGIQKCKSNICSTGLLLR
jgi:hypothetical protein